MNAEHHPDEVGLFCDHVAMGTEHHVQRPHRRRVRIFHQRSDPAGQRYARARLCANIRVDVATRQSDMHFAEGDADRLDVLDRHAFHPQSLQEEHFLGGARKHGDALALQIPDRSNPCVFLRNDRHAAVAGRGNYHDRLAGGGAEQCSGNAERAEIDRLGHDGVLAFGRRFERQHLDLVPRRHELIVEIGRYGMDQL